MDYVCKHCSNPWIEDISTYNDLVFATTPAARFKCRSCGKVSLYREGVPSDGASRTNDHCGSGRLGPRRH